jgi:hypothetical protein
MVSFTPISPMLGDAEVLHCCRLGTAARAAPGDAAAPASARSLWHLCPPGLTESQSQRCSVSRQAARGRQDQDQDRQRQHMHSTTADHTTQTAHNSNLRPGAGLARHAPCMSPTSPSRPPRLVPPVQREPLAPGSGSAQAQARTRLYDDTDIPGTPKLAPFPSIVSSWACQRA